MMYYMNTENKLNLESVNIEKKVAQPEEIAKILRQEANHKGYLNVKIVRKGDIFRVYHNDELIYITNKGWAT